MFTAARSLVQDALQKYQRVDRIALLCNIKAQINDGCILSIYPPETVMSRNVIEVFRKITLLN